MIAKPAAAASPVKMARDDEAVMLVRQQTGGGTLQHSPVLRVRLNHRVAESIDFVQPTQVLQRLNRQIQVVSHAQPVGTGIQRQLAESLVSDFEVARLERLLAGCSLRRLPWLLRRT